MSIETDNMKRAAAIRLPETEGVVALHFMVPDTDWQYLWEAVPGDWDAKIKRVQEVNLNGAGLNGIRPDRWFVFAVADCWDPPLYALCSSSWEEAYEEFIDWQGEALGLWITPEEMKDYKEEDLKFDNNGHPVDTDNVQGYEVKLVRVDLLP